MHMTTKRVAEVAYDISVTVSGQKGQHCCAVDATLWNTVDIYNISVNFLQVLSHRECSERTALLCS